MSDLQPGVDYAMDVLEKIMAGEIRRLAEHYQPRFALEHYDRLTSLHERGMVGVSKEVALPVLVKAMVEKFGGDGPGFKDWCKEELVARRGIAWHEITAHMIPLGGEETRLW